MPGPRIAITMGDAAGVGPEIIMKSLGHRDLYARCRPLVIGDAERLRAAGRLVGSELQVASIAELTSRILPMWASGPARSIASISRSSRRISPGESSRRSRATRPSATFRPRRNWPWPEKLRAICTAPLNKEALHAGGHIYPGHTELLAALTGTPEVSMMLTAPNLRVIHVTTHMGLLDAIDRIEPGLVEPHHRARPRSIGQGRHSAAENRRVRNQSACR